MILQYANEFLNTSVPRSSCVPFVGNMYIADIGFFCLGSHLHGKYRSSEGIVQVDRQLGKPHQRVRKDECKTGQIKTTRIFPLLRKQRHIDQVKITFLVAKSNFIRSFVRLSVCGSVPRSVCGSRVSKKPRTQQNSRESRPIQRKPHTKIPQNPRLFATIGPVSLPQSLEPQSLRAARSVFSVTRFAVRNPIRTLLFLTFKNRNMFVPPRSRY